MSNPDQLEKNIEHTRESLSGNVDRLNDKVSPSKVVNRRIDRLKNGAGTVKERLMGYADDRDGQRAALNSAASSVQDKTNVAAAKLSDAAGSAPGAVRDQTQGSPLAAGLIAFGLGWLASALVPVSTAEQQVAEKAEQNAGGLVEPLKQSAQEVASNLQQPLQESADQLKQSASEATSKTADQAQSAKSDLDRHNPLT